MPIAQTVKVNKGEYHRWNGRKREKYITSLNTHIHNINACKGSNYWANQDVFKFLLTNKLLNASFLLH